MSETLTTANKKTKPDKARLQKFKWRKYLALFAIFILLIYLLSLILLNTSWAKGKLTHRLHEKTNSDWEIGTVHWIPFGEIVMNDLQTSIGEGGVKIESISVKPSWNHLFSGSLEVIEATVSDADIDLDVKWLAENRAKIEGSVVIPEPELSPLSNQSSQPEPSKPIENPATNTNQKTLQNNAQNQTNIPAPVIASEQTINTAPNRWLKLEKLNITLRHGEKIIEKISDLSASIPIAGKPANGEVKFKFLGDDYIQSLIWDGQDLRAEETSGKFKDVNFQWRTICRINQIGIPFAFQLIIPQQKLNHHIDKPNIHLNISSDKIAANLIVNGGLKNPNTWRGIVNIFSENTTIIENQKTHKRMNFDYTRLVATLTNSTLSVPIAEAIGHKTSILANGSVHKNLYSYGTVRVISNNEAAEFLERFYHGSRFIKVDHGYHLLAPLFTRDRMYCDIYLDGKLTNLEIRHDRSNGWQPLNQSIKKLIDFKNNELTEDGLLEN